MHTFPSAYFRAMGMACRCHHLCPVSLAPCVAYSRCLVNAADLLLTREPGGSSYE